jgi:hypothetical protein
MGLALLMLVSLVPFALAKNTLVSQQTIVAGADTALIVAPDRDWNRMGARPGRSSETWTIDGEALNDVTFYVGIKDGQTLFREVSKRNKPLPHFSSTMLLTDIPALLEQSYSIALGTQVIKVDAIEPTMFLASSGVKFTYSFARPDEDVRRRGEGTAAMIGGRLYMITYEAPELYYFDHYVAAYRSIVNGARLSRPTSR